MNPHLFGALSNQQISFRLILMDIKILLSRILFLPLCGRVFSSSGGHRAVLLACRFLFSITASKLLGFYTFLSGEINYLSKYKYYLTH